MMKSLFQPTEMQIKRGLGAFLTLAFFLLLGIGQAAAQNYVSPAEADTKLKAETEVLYAQLLSETPGTPLYNNKYATMNYYEGIRLSLAEGTSVALAIDKGQARLCYPSDTADCQGLPKPDAYTVVQATKQLLTQ
jgi:hypothetical protein